MLLWRNAARIWKAKGYSLTTVADELEKEFGSGRKLTRGPLSLLVTTRCEPCPPDVEQFIREGLPVKNRESWAEYLANVANGSPEDEVPPLTLDLSDFREVARQVAAEVAKTVRGWLDVFGGRLDGVGSKLDAVSEKLDCASEKLEGIQTTVRNTEAKIDQVLALQKSGRHVTWPMVGFVLLLGLLFADRLVQSDTSRAGPTSAAAWRTALAELLGLGKKSQEYWIPKEPYPWQKLAKDCKRSLGEEAINGGCWVYIYAVKPPCGELFRHGDGCYRPVIADQSKPVGLVRTVPGQP
ncbi:MAG TPA: hypothetical protein VK447_08195 [Myxococcaceae bacterium]|nr:hypothetical protein [Myxococcaceae bacterium]